MEVITYCLTFHGQASPANSAGSILQASSHAASTRFDTVVSGAGVEFTTSDIDGDTASFTSKVYMTAGTSFTEDGHIEFGDGNLLHFDSLSPGYLAPAPIDGLSHGVINWRVTGGHGRFAGARGLITSNFTVDAAGTVTDHQFGVVYVD